MKLQLDSGDSQFAITSYGVGQVVVNEERLTRSCIVGPGGLVRDWGPGDVREMLPRHLEAILALEPEVIILGTGARQIFPDTRVMEPLIRRQVGLEVMDTGAACRTYNILLAEGRRIAAGLMMI
ncbi:MAG: Mth938-like domain-containing protein [Gammaproteobacteria bacterium]|nr:Mth938-like domain-containing protein [Gammaproteobacteria bacterium]